MATKIAGIFTPGNWDQCEVGGRGGLSTDNIKISLDCYHSVRRSISCPQYNHCLLISLMVFLSSICFKFSKATKEQGEHWTEQWTMPDFHFTCRCRMQFSVGWRRKEILTHFNRKFSPFSVSSSKADSEDQTLPLTMVSSSVTKKYVGLTHNDLYYSRL